jgi:hypothetical protein
VKSGPGGQGENGVGREGVRPTLFKIMLYGKNIALQMYNKCITM